MTVRRRRRGAIAAMVAIIIFSAMIFVLALSWEETASDLVQRSVQTNGLEVNSAYQSGIEAARSQTVSQIGIWDMNTEDPDDDDMLSLYSWGSDGSPKMVSLPQDFMFSVAETWPIHNRVWGAAHAIKPPIQDFYMAGHQQPALSVNYEQRIMDTLAFARNMAQWKHAWYGFTGPDRASGIYTFNVPTAGELRFADASAWGVELRSLHPLVSLGFDHTGEYSLRANNYFRAPVPETQPDSLWLPAFALQLDSCDIAGGDAPLKRLEAIDKMRQFNLSSSTSGTAPAKYFVPTYHMLRWDGGRVEDSATKGHTLLRVPRVPPLEDCYWPMDDPDSSKYVFDPNDVRLIANDESLRNSGDGYGMAGTGLQLTGGGYLRYHSGGLPIPTTALNLHFWVKLDAGSPRNNQLIMHMGEHFGLQLLSTGQLRWYWNKVTDLSAAWDSVTTSGAAKDWSRWHHIAINQRLITSGANQNWRITCVIDGQHQTFTVSAGATADNPRMGTGGAPFFHVGGTAATLAGGPATPSGTIELDELHYRDSSFPVFDNRSVNGLVPCAFPGDPNATGSGPKQWFASRFIEYVSGVPYIVTDDLILQTDPMPWGMSDADPAYYDILDSGFTIELRVHRNLGTSWALQAPVVQKMLGFGVDEPNWHIKVSDAGQVYFGYRTSGGASYGIGHPGTPYPPNSGNRLEAGDTRLITITGEVRTDGRLYYFIGVDGDVHAHDSSGNSIRTGAGDFLIDADTSADNNGNFWIDDFRVTSAFSPQYAADFTLPDYTVHSPGAIEQVSDYPAAAFGPDTAWGDSWKIGHGSYVELPNPLDSSKEGFTFETWVKRDGAQAQGCIGGIYDITRPVGELGWFLAIDELGDVWFRYRRDTGAIGGNKTGINLPPDQWRYLTFVYDNTTRQMWTHAGYPDALTVDSSGSPAYAQGIYWGRTNGVAAPTLDTTTPFRIGMPYNMGTVYDRTRGAYPGSDLLIHSPMFKPYKDTSYTQKKGIHPPFTESPLIQPVAAIEDLRARLAGPHDPRGPAYDSGRYWLEAGRSGVQVPDPVGTFLKPEDGFSAQFWLYQDVKGAWGGIVASKWTGRLDPSPPGGTTGESCNSFFIRSYDDGLGVGGGKIRLGLQVAGQRLRTFDGPAGMEMNKAHHVVVVYDPALQRVSIGVDGSFRHYEGNKFIEPLYTNAVSLEIGGNQLLGSPVTADYQYFIDDFKYYPEPLREFYAFPSRSPIAAPWCAPTAPERKINNWMTSGVAGVMGTSALQMRAGHLSFQPQDASCYWWDPIREDAWQAMMTAMVKIGAGGREYIVLSNWREFDDMRRYKIGINRNNELYYAFTDDGLRSSLESCRVGTLRRLTPGKWHQIIVAFDKWDPGFPSPVYLGVGAASDGLPSENYDNYDVDVVSYGTNAWLADLETPSSPPFATHGGPSTVGGKAPYDTTPGGTGGLLSIDRLMILDEFDPLLCQDHTGLFASDSLYTAGLPVRVSDNPWGQLVGDSAQASTYSYDFDPVEGQNFYLGNWDNSDVIGSWLVPYKTFADGYGDDFSLKFWLKMQTTPPTNLADGRHIVVSKWSELSSGRSFKAELNPYPGDATAHQLTFLLSSTGNDVIVYSYPNKLLVNNWHHIYLAFQNGRLTANVDGFIDTVDLSATLTQVYECKAPLYFGRSQTERPSNGSDKMLLNEIVMQQMALPWFEVDRLGPGGWVPAAWDVPGRPYPLHSFPRFDYHCGPDAATVPAFEGGPHVWRAGPANTDLLDRCVQLKLEAGAADPATGQYLLASLPNEYKTLQEFTFDFWTYVDIPADGRPRSLLGHGSTYRDNLGNPKSSDAWELMARNVGGGLRVGLDTKSLGDSINGWAFDVSGALVPRTWTHIGLIFDGYDKSLSSGTVILYINGFEVGRAGIGIAAFKLLGCPLWLGCSPTQDDLFLATHSDDSEILIDEIRYLDRALTDWRISTGTPRFDPLQLIHHRRYTGLPVLSLREGDSLGFTVSYPTTGNSTVPRIDSWVKNIMSEKYLLDVRRRGSHSED